MSTERLDTVESMIAVLKEITYKPNFSLWWESYQTFDRNFGYTLRVKVDMRVPNSRIEDYRSPKEVNVTKVVGIPIGMPKDLFILYIRDLLWGMEDHECNEWFKYQGNRLNDEHKESTT